MYMYMHVLSLPSNNAIFRYNVLIVLAGIEHWIESDSDIERGIPIEECSIFLHQIHSINDNPDQVELHINMTVKVTG